MSDHTELPQALNMTSYTSIQKITLLKFTFSTILFILSLVFFPYYTEGDQRVYREVYNSLPGFDLIDGYKYYLNTLSSRELVHFFLAWFASPYINHNIFIAIFNGVFAYAILSLFQKWGASLAISVTILFTNYYLLVLYFPAERLKFAFLFLAFSLINTNSKKFFIYLVLALMSHVQTIVIYSSVFLSYLVKKFRRKKLPKLIFTLPFILVIPAYLLSDQLIHKYNIYSNLDYGGLVGTWKVAVFFLLSIYYSKDKLETISLFALLFFAVFLVGGMRLNIFGYFIFLYYGLQFNGGKNFGVAITSAYYLYGSVIFIVNIIQYGTAFQY